MSEFKNYKLFIYKDNQFIRIKSIIFENKDNTFNFHKYRPCIVNKKILQTNSLQNLYTIDKELLFCQ